MKSTLLACSLLLMPAVLRAEVEITPDVVYGHKLGLAMTLDVFAPKENANGAGILFMVSGGWHSHWSPPEGAQVLFRPLTDRGYTVFAVRHGSSPRFSIAEAVSDVRRSVRFVRMNADRFHVDPGRLGVYGASAGGHLSLMLGTTGDDGDKSSKDPVLRVSDHVQAVVAWVAPTDLRNIIKGQPDRLPAYDRFPALDLNAEEAAANSPLAFVSQDDPPALLVVGDKDELVPMYHSEKIHKAFEAVGVASRLVVLEGAGHGFGGKDAETAVRELGDWFDRHLAKKDPTTAQAESGVLPVARPESVGMSPEKLAEVMPALQEFVDEHKVPGAIVAVARHGKLVLFDATGWRDIESNKPMGRDSILRFYSMTKPITSAALMILVDEGRVGLDDPVSKYLPEFADLRVYKSGNGDSLETGEVRHPMTVRDLLRHSSGLTYGFFGNTPVDQMYRRQGILSPADDLKTTITKLAGIPLAFQPGTRFNYSVSADVSGRLVEVVSEMPLDEFFRKRIFEPLNMKDTGFSVPAESRDRFANNYGPDSNGLRVVDPAEASRYLTPPRLLSGGGGLVSTAGDYMRFCQMLLNGGELDGRRILRESTVAMMRANQLPDSAWPISIGGSERTGVGFGLGFSVVADRIPGHDYVPMGEYGWGGMASTHFWISPKHDLAVVVLTQLTPFSMQLESTVKPLVYAAIED